MNKEYDKYIKEVEKYYSKNYNKYHTIHHIENLFELYFRWFRNKFLKEFPDLDEDDLFWTIAWHDCVYIPGCDLNEFLSAQAYYYTMRKKLEFRDYLEVDFPVYAFILSTKIGNEVFDTPEKMVMHDLDWSIFTDYYHNFVKYSDKILFESTYDGIYSFKEVKENQLIFYKSLIGKQIYVTKTFSDGNDIAQKNLIMIIKKLEKELEDK